MECMDIHGNRSIIRENENIEHWTSIVVLKVLNFRVFLDKDVKIVEYLGLSNRLLGNPLTTKLRFYNDIFKPSVSYVQHLNRKSIRVKKKFILCLVNHTINNCWA
jgi:hypothetical protein